MSCAGIDLGTTQTCICTYNLNNEIHNINDNKSINKNISINSIKDFNICLNNNNEETTSSYIKINYDNNLQFVDYSIGNIAKNNIDVNTFYNMKRFIGKTYKECETDLKLCGFKYKNENNQLKILFNKEYLNPEDITSLFLKELVEQCNKKLETPIKYCIITVPAYFNTIQRRLTKQAGENAGLNVLQIIDEPCASALTYNLINNDNKDDNDKENIKVGYVIDNVIKYENNNIIDNNKINDTICDNKNNNNCIVNNKINELYSSFESDSRILVFDFGGGTLDISILDVNSEGVVAINTIGINHLGGEDIDNLLVKVCLSAFSKINNLTSIETRQLCENQYILQRLRVECEKAKILLSITNGINIYIKNFYGTKDLNVDFSYENFLKLITPITNKCIELLDKSLIVNNVNIIKTIKNVILIGGSTKLFVIKELLDKYFNNDSSNPKINILDKIDPDLSVAIGACIHCKNLLKPSLNVILLDTINHSIGIETINNQYEIIIPKNTLKPCVKSRVFSTAVDNQRIFKLKIYEGENNEANKNTLIKEIIKNDLVPKPSGYVKFIIEFKIDENGVFAYNIKNYNNQHDIQFIETYTT